MIKTFLFDLGNVLLFFSHEKMCRHMGMLCGKSGEEIQQLFIETKRYLVFERGEMSESEFHTWFLQESGAEVPMDKLR
jgi:putative hydrolase of the HAD superfamily